MNRCQTCGRFIRKGTTHCEQEQGNLFDRAAMIERVNRNVDRLFMKGRNHE